jgi:hypothetical protein
MGLLDVKVDTSKFEEWCDEISSRGLKSAIRRAVDTSATAARKVALKTIAADIGVPVARIKDAVGKVKRTTQTNLSASFTTTKKAINILATGATASRQVPIDRRRQRTPCRAPCIRHDGWGQQIYRSEARQRATPGARTICRIAIHRNGPRRRSGASGLEESSRCRAIAALGA